jgi:predicted nucleic acid-binding protein
VSEGFGATVTGTVGVIVRGVSEGMSEKDAKETVRLIDGNGLHMTAELREKAYELIDERTDG